MKMQKQKVDINIIKNKTIILIDDVATTGSTLNEAAKILRLYNPNKIIAVVLAKN